MNRCRILAQVACPMLNPARQIPGQLRLIPDKYRWSVNSKVLACGTQREQIGSVHDLFIRFDADCARKGRDVRRRSAPCRVASERASVHAHEKAERAAAFHQ